MNAPGAATDVADEKRTRPSADLMRALHVLCHDSGLKQPQAVLFIGLPESSSCALNGVGRFLKDDATVIVLAAPGETHRSLRVNLGRDQRLVLEDRTADGVEGRFAVDSPAVGQPGFHPQKGPVSIVEARHLANFQDQCTLGGVEAVCVLQAHRPVELIADLARLCPRIRVLIAHLHATDGHDALAALPEWLRPGVLLPEDDGGKHQILIAAHTELAREKLEGIINKTSFAPATPGHGKQK